MISTLKLLALTILVGSNTAYWGHTYLAEGNSKVYALRSLSENSSLCTFDSEVLKGKIGIIELPSLQVPMKVKATNIVVDPDGTMLRKMPMVANCQTALTTRTML